MVTLAGPAALEETPIEDVLRAGWEIGPPEDIRPLVGGKSQHFVIRTPRGEFALRRSYRSKTIASLAFEHALMAHLRAAGFPAPEVVPTRGGGTWLDVDGRLHTLTVFVRGEAPSGSDPVQVAEVAAHLARYHDLVESFRPPVAPPEQPSMAATLRQRLEGLPGGGAASPDGSALPLAFAVELGWEALGTLERLAPRLPRLVIHAGCRRGSVVYQGRRLALVLDFDSAHVEERIVDVAVAVHDFAKVYGDPSSAAYKVPLDPGVVSLFVAGYRAAGELLPAELEALPAYLTAKRLKRALGRHERLVRGEPLSPADHRKIALEMRRVQWLHDNREMLVGLAAVPSQ
jgi:Ser/Thr protein kinase RdoA (MazF antagonist)